MLVNANFSQFLAVNFFLVVIHKNVFKNRSKLHKTDKKLIKVPCNQKRACNLPLLSYISFADLVKSYKKN